MDIDVSDKVLICGGGIGGLALGVALAKVKAQASYSLRPVRAVQMKELSLSPAHICVTGVHLEPPMIMA